MSKVTVNEFAELHGITPQAVYQRASRGKLHLEEINGIKYIIVDDQPDFEKMFNDLKLESEWIKRENKMLHERIEEMREQLAMNKEAFELWRRILPQPGQTAAQQIKPEPEPEEIIEAEPEESIDDLADRLKHMSKKEKLRELEKLSKKERKELAELLKKRKKGK